MSHEPCEIEFIIKSSYITVHSMFEFFFFILIFYQVWRWPAS